jgi:hypothetical protein
MICRDLDDLLMITADVTEEYGQDQGDSYRLNISSNVNGVTTQ